MKKYIAKGLLLGLLLQSPAAYADDYSSFDEGYYYECCSEWSIAAKAAAFFPLSSKARKIYGSALPEFTLEGNFKVWDGCWSDIYLWLDGNYVYGNGNSYGGEPHHHRTHLTLVPVTLGLKFAYHLCDWADFYLGAGPTYAWLQLRDSSSHVHRKTNRSAVGGIFKSGVVASLCGCYYLEGFFNYSYQRFDVRKPKHDPTVERHDADLSSLQLGAGVGWRF